MGTLLAGRDGGVAVLSGAMNRVDPASSKPCLDDLEAKSPILIFLYFHKAIRTELDELQRSAMAFATGQLADIQPLFECYHFVRSIYKHHSNAEDEAYACRNYVCPICSKCMGDMADILCNDCEQKGVARFHWLYHKCAFCGSYNTKAIKSEPRNSDCPPSHQ